MGNWATSSFDYQNSKLSTNLLSSDPLVGRSCQAFNMVNEVSYSLKIRQIPCSQVSIRPLSLTCVPLLSGNVDRTAVTEPVVEVVVTL